MSLIFVTRIVDRKDTRSGFIFDWIDAFADRVDRLYIICLEKGDITGLPANVEVGSMGKENNSSQLAELFQYWKFLTKWLPASNGVLAHMHPIYAICAWPLTVFYGKKLGLWYTHKSQNNLLKAAHALVDVVFTASKESFRLSSKKVKVMGHGIDVRRFERTSYPERGDGAFKIVSVGRISPSKDYETLIKALAGLSNVKADIYGDPALKSDETYLVNLLEMVENEKLEDVFSFHPGVSYEEVPRIYSQTDVFVNLSQTGSIDKTVLEAAASKTLVLTSNEAFYLPLMNISPMLVSSNNDPAELAAKIHALTKLGADEKALLCAKLYDWVIAEHDLEQLAQRLVQFYEGN